MPDNLNQDWTDDAAFWDEAWGDMSARLDQAERKRFFVWWRLSGLGLLVLVPIVLFYYWQESLSKTPTQGTSPAVEVQADEIIAEAPPESGSAKLKINQKGEQPTPDQASLPTPTPPTTLEKITETQVPTSPLASSAPLTSSVPVDCTSTAVTSSEKIPQSQGKDTQEPTSPEPPVSVSNPGESEASINRLVPTALPQLTPLAIENLSWSRPAPSPGVIPSRKTRRKAALALEAGLNTGGIPDFGGEFVGFRYAIPLSDKWSVPLGLRFQHHNWRISRLDNGMDFEMVADPGSPTNQDGTFSLSALSSEELDRVITNQITLRSGLEYLAGKRWSLFGGTGIHYFLSGRGPFSSGSGLRLASLSFNRGGSQEDAQSVGGGNSFRESSPVTANSFGLSLHGGAGYRLGNRWTVFGEFSLLTTPIYQGKPASVELSRMGLGIRYRLR